MLCVPDDEGPPATYRLLRPPRGMHRFTWPDDPTVEFHLGHGDWIRLLRANGFDVEDLIELWLPTGVNSDANFVTPEWAVALALRGSMAGPTALREQDGLGGGLLAVSENGTSFALGDSGASGTGKVSHDVVVPRLVEISSGVLVATSRREATTSTVIVGPSARVLLVDPAWEPDELDALAAELAAAGLQVEAGLATHAHYDHVLWHPDFGRVPRWASEETVRTVTDERQALLCELGPEWPARLAEVFGYLDVVERPLVPWSGPPVELVEHGGHQAGHLAAWLPESRVLVAGDMLSDVELPIADETQPLEVYAEGLERLRPYAAAAAIVVPGHGTVGHRPLARWEADQHYISALLDGGDPADPRCTNDGMAEIHDANLRVARERR